MKLLVLGGTRFLGRAVVEAALARGHDVTLFNRGVTNPELFPQAKKLRGDLATDSIPDSYDAVIDLDPTKLPQHVPMLDAGHYVFVSTISVYADPSQPLDESSPVFEPVGAEVFDEALYGALKVVSERKVQELYGARAAIVRPGLIVGPHDPTDRFTYWPRRLAEGGDVLAPGDPAAPVQLIDVRDLGTWLVRVAEDRLGGVFNATGPAEPTTLGELLERVAAAVGGGARLRWVDGQRVLDAGVQPWSELPLWAPGVTGFLRADISRALAAGLAFRPIAETARDTLAWSREAGEQSPTLSREREAEILAGA